jgi:hypothetical protein
MVGRSSVCVSSYMVPIQVWLQTGISLVCLRSDTYYILYLLSDMLAGRVRCHSHFSLGLGYSSP